MIDLRKGIGMTSARTRDRLVQRLKDQGIRSDAVLSRIRNVPRHLFVDEALASRAYEDTALPIGHGQTISQPFIVALMTDLLQLEALTELPSARWPWIANADSLRVTSSLLQSGQATVSARLNTSSSKSWPQPWQTYS